MLKFFRRIKRKLIDEGNLKRYLIYSVGEILLVMVGILLALQVNNWNLNRINEKKEQKILSDLYEEFKLNKQRIEEKQNLRTSAAPKLKDYLDSMLEGNASYNSFREFHRERYEFGMTNPSNGVVDALISSGEITLISNDSLKYLIADWKDQAGNLLENEQILWEITLSYNSIYQKFILSPKQVWKDWESNNYEEAFSKLSSDMEYRNKLVGYEGAQRIVIEECNNILESISNTLKLIEKELHKK